MLIWRVKRETVPFSLEMMAGGPVPVVGWRVDEDGEVMPVTPYGTVRAGANKAPGIVPTVVLIRDPSMDVRDAAGEMVGRLGGIKDLETQVRVIFSNCEHAKKSK